MVVPTDLSSLIALLFSFSALRDWLKLIVIGGFFETFRRLVFSLYYKIVDSFFITAYFEENDTSYDWMMFWLSKHPSTAKIRQLQVSTRLTGLNTNATMLPGQEDTNESLLTSRKMAFLPSSTIAYTVWYKHRWVSISRIQKQTGFYGQTEETLAVKILTRHHRILHDLLFEARKDYMAAQQNTISIFVSDINNSWRLVASRPKRPLRSIILDPGIKDLLIDDARDFLESKQWYHDRGIPFRRGYLLYGAPGTGKTSIISSIAGELGLNVFIVSLSRAGLDDSSLSELISDLPERSIALMEDIDAAFTHNLNRDSTQATEAIYLEELPKSPGNGKAPPPPPTTSRLSLSGLLNALDGVGAQEGRILYATTNKYSSLDPALSRPGRMDIHVEFKLASKYQARELFRCFYLPSDEDADVEKSGSGYNSSASGDRDVENSSDATESDVAQSPISPLSADSGFTGTSHRARAPKLSRRQVAELADKFADTIPDREFSMAALQGFLMSYKVRPFEAVRDAEVWVGKERAAALEAEKKATAPPPVANASLSPVAETNTLSLSVVTKNDRS